MWLQRGNPGWPLPAQSHQQGAVPRAQPDSYSPVREAWPASLAVVAYSCFQRTQSLTTLLSDQPFQ
jgi:hypothetical protein